MKIVQNEILGAGQNAKGTDTISLVEYHKLRQRRSKYGARKALIYGITFASLAEGARYVELKLLEQAGAIVGLTCQPKHELLPSFRDAQGNYHRAIYYVADFQYSENGKVVIEDVKGGRATQTAVFKIKMKLFLYKYSRLYEFRIIES